MKYLTTPVLAFLLLTSCTTEWQGEAREFRDDMRLFVERISGYARLADSNFIIIPQNGHELLTANGMADGAVATEYIDTIDGVGREDLLYGYDSDDKPTKAADSDAMLAFMNLAESQGVQVLATDYCSTPSKIDDSYARSEAKGYVSFAAPKRNLDIIPAYPSAPYNVNTGHISALSDAKNFLYLLNPSPFASKSAYLNALSATDYDIIIMDLFYEDSEGNPTALTLADLARLKTKANGGTRVLICYMSIGEAEDYRYYWEDSWKKSKPEWLAKENPDWKGNYKVEYWHPDWQALIYGSTDAYLDRIMAAGFDGVYLDIIDAYEFFEESVR